MDESLKETTLIEVNEVFEKYKKKRWFLLALGVLIMVSVSVCYAWSLLSAPISKEFSSWNETMGGFTFTAFMYSYGIFGVVSGVLAHKLKNVRINLTISAICMGIGFWISSFAQDFSLLLVGFSFLGGAGAAFAYNAVIVTVTKWFNDRLGLATGSVLMGYGVGPFVIGSLYTFVVENGIAWQTIFQFFGIVIGIVLILGAVFFIEPPQDYVTPTRLPKVDRFPVETQEMSPLAMIRRLSFWILFLMGCTATMPPMVYSGFGRQLVQNVSPTVDANMVAFIVGGISIANGCGRIFTGWINDKFGMGVNIRVSALGVSLGVVLILLATLAQSLVFIAFALLFAGFTAGMSIPDGALIVRKLYGEKHYQMNLQVLMLAGFVNSLGVTIFGNIYELSGGFILPLITLLGISFIGFICASLIKKP